MCTLDCVRHVFDHVPWRRTGEDDTQSWDWDVRIIIDNLYVLRGKIDWTEASCLQQRTWLTAYNENAGNGNVVRPHQIYAVALYWAVMTMSTIGYGDVQPQTTLERSYVIGCMVVGASVYAYMVGAVCGIVASMWVLPLAISIMCLSKLHLALMSIDRPQSLCCVQKHAPTRIVHECTRINVSYIIIY